MCLKRPPSSSLMFLFGVVLGVSITLTFHLQWRAASTIPSPVPALSLGLRSHEHKARCPCVGSSRPQALDELPSSSSNYTLGQGKDRPHISPFHGSDGHKVPIMEKLLVGVISKSSEPNLLEAVYDSWGRDAMQLLMFVGHNFNLSHASARGLPLVRLDSVSEVSALRYFSEHYLGKYQWFMLTLDSSYVRIDKLQQFLSQLNPREMLYMGRSATGRKTETDKLGLKPHEHYCLGSSGIVLSSALLSELSPHLEQCMASAAGIPTDVQLGKCISAKLAVQCTASEKVCLACKQISLLVALSLQTRLYFFEDYSGEEVSGGYLELKGDIFSTLITYHPVSSLMAMKRLHYHYKQMQLSTLLDQLHTVEKEIADACEVIGGNCAPSPCPCKESRCDACPPAGIVTSLATPYQATSEYDYQPWIYFDATTIYQDHDVNPSYSFKLRKEFRQELKHLLAKAVQKLSERQGKSLKFKKLVNGWMRHNPFIGNEYIVDSLLLDGRKYLTKRINLVQPLATNFITRKDNSDASSVINMVVPLTKVTKRFLEFMTMFEELALVKAERVRLILSVYGTEDVKFVTSVVENYQQKYLHADILIVEGRGEFSRGKALHKGISFLSQDELIFICDVDMHIEKSFLERCRKNTIMRKRVYYPEFFKLYNMDYVYWNQPRPHLLTLKRSHGHWAYYSFGMLCIYKCDYIAAGGMDTNIQGWGDEDVQFFRKVVKRRLEVLRAPDTALSHRWHQKLCSKKLSKKQYKHCRYSQHENFADRRELAAYIQDRGLEIKPSETGVVDLASNFTSDDDDEYYDYAG